MRRYLTPLHLLCGGLLSLFIAGIVGLILADGTYLVAKGLGPADIWALLTREQVLFAIRMSLATSLCSLALILVTAVPIAYALSRYRFPGHAVVNTLVDVPIVLPPVVIGISLLCFFSFGFGIAIKQALAACQLHLVSSIGIVLCQYLVAISYCIRAVKAAFDNVDPELEQVAGSLGCPPWQVFWRVSLPLARGGILAGGIMAWARALGVFGPLMVFIGTAPRVMVMPTTLWLELSIGNIETSVAIALIMLLMAGSALVLVHWLSPEGRAL